MRGRHPRRGEECDDGNTITEACEYGESSCEVCAADCTEQPGAVTGFCGFGGGGNGGNGGGGGCGYQGGFGGGSIGNWDQNLIPGEGGYSYNSGTSPEGEDGVRPGHGQVRIVLIP